MRARAHYTNKQKTMKLKKILTTGAIFSAAALSVQAAGETVPAEEMAKENEESPWAFAISLDANSHFMSYGANVWKPDTDDIGDEWLFQPSATIDYAINDVSGAYVGIWFDINDLADDPDVGPDLGDDTQEMDVWVGYWHTFGNFTLDLTFQQWYYASETEGIIDFTISYDAMFAPYLKAHTRIEAVGDQEKGTIYEAGVTLYEGEISGVAYAFNAGVAFNFDDFHVEGEDGYAYSFIGASASYVIYSSDSLDVDLHGGLTYFDTDEDNVGNFDSDGDSVGGILTANFGIGFSF